MQPNGVIRMSDRPDLVIAAKYDLDINGNGEHPPDPFWEARESLRHIRQFAYARMVSPWSVLGAVLLRAIYHIPPWVHLPATIGGIGSLNLFCAVVGPSGAGKGTSDAAAKDAFHMGAKPVYKIAVGSGEGISKQYAHYDHKIKNDDGTKGGLVRDRDRVLFTCPEVDALRALGTRNGSTLISQLRLAYSGEQLGFAYGDNTKRLIIDEHSYRLCFTVGVQPERAEPLLNDAGGGTPQRFIWLPAIDQGITENPPPAPEPITLKPRDWYQWGDTRGWTIKVTDEAIAEVRRNHVLRVTGKGDPLDGHSLYTQLKVAVALALLADRTEEFEVTFADWELARKVMAKSDATRTAAVAAVKRKREKEGTGRAMEQGRQEVIKGEVMEGHHTQRVCQLILGKLTQEWVNASDVRRGLRKNHRDHFETAVDLLIQSGQIEMEETDYKGQHRRRLRLADKHSR
jgi:hypothetical protein